MTAYCLDMHAGYACRHSGACCSSGWAIPVEGPRYETLTVHFAERLRHERLFITGGPLPHGAAAILATDPVGSCVFFEGEAGRLCTIHRELGESSLPVACRQFPRVVLRDGRGTLVTLSHFCPTAASLLLEAAAPRIVPAPASLALDGDLEGLDASESLPPLLHPHMLMDLNGYAAWEHRAVDILACSGGTADRALAAIESATGLLESWHPGSGPLVDAVHRAFDSAKPDGCARDSKADQNRLAVARASVPAELTVPEIPEGFADLYAPACEWLEANDAVVRRYLAARLFGNWIAYYGSGLRTIVESLRVALAVLRAEAVRQLPESTGDREGMMEAVRQSDLLLVHLSDPKELARGIDMLCAR